MKVSRAIAVAVVASTSLLTGVQSFVAPQTSATISSTSTRSSVVIFMSDVPKDEVTKDNKANNSRKKQQQREEQWMLNHRRIQKEKKKNWRDDWLPEPPEDALTLGGDVASLFLYAFMDHFLNEVMLGHILSSSTSAADLAHTLDPSGQDLVLASTPVWLDPTAVGPHVSDQVLFWDLQSRVTPHFTPLLSDAGVAGVTLATCWILAGLFHKAFHYQNTLDCSTHRAVTVTGKTWLSASILLTLLATASHHLVGTVDVQDVSTSVLMMEGRTLTPIEEWFSVLTRADSEYIFNSLGVLLTWRFMISFLLGGWSKK